MSKDVWKSSWPCLRNTSRGEVSQIFVYERAAEEEFCILVVGCVPPFLLQDRRRGQRFIVKPLIAPARQLVAAPPIIIAVAITLSTLLQQCPLDFQRVQVKRQSRAICLTQ